MRRALALLALLLALTATPAQAAAPHTVYLPLVTRTAPAWELGPLCAVDGQAWHCP